MLALASRLAQPLLFSDLPEIETALPEIETVLSEIETDLSRLPAEQSRFPAGRSRFPAVRKIIKMALRAVLKAGLRIKCQSYVGNLKKKKKSF